MAGNRTASCYVGINNNVHALAFKGEKMMRREDDGVMMGQGTHRRSCSSWRRLSPAFAIAVALTAIVSCCCIRGISASVSAPSSVSPRGVGAGVPHDIQRRQSMDTIITVRGGNTNVQNKRRNCLTKILTRIGDMTTTTTIVRGGGVGSAVVGQEILPPRAPISSMASLLSKSSSIILSILATTINIACGAFVSSGYFGAYFASMILRTIHHLDILPSMVTMTANNEKTDGGGAYNIEPTKNKLLLPRLVEGKYHWTSIATLLSILLHVVIACTDSTPNNYSIHSLIDNASFTTILWVYSHMVDPFLGGAIGIAHVALGGLSMMLGNHRLRTTVYRLGGVWRLKKLNQYNIPGGGKGGGDEDDVYIDPLKAMRPVREPVLISTSAPMASAIANGMGSASVLLVFPQYFLGLYMLGSSFISWWSNYRQSNNGNYFISRLVRWLSEGGTLSCARYSGGCDGLRGHFDSPWKLATRLVALYWMTVLSKTMLALIVISRIDTRSSTRRGGD